jgi:hypothetical protein
MQMLCGITAREAVPRKRGSVKLICAIQPLYPGFKIRKTSEPAGDVNGHWVPLCEVGPTAHERQKRDTNGDVVRGKICEQRPAALVMVGRVLHAATGLTAIAFGSWRSPSTR